MTTDGDTPAEARSGITFGVTLEVPWNAPEAYVQLHSDGVFDLDTVPDVLGLCGRRPDASVVRVLQGCDTRSVRVYIVGISLGGWQDMYTERLVDSVVGRAQVVMSVLCVARGDPRAYRWHPREVTRARVYMLRS